MDSNKRESHSCQCSKTSNQNTNRIEKKIKETKEKKTLKKVNSQVSLLPLEIWSGDRSAEHHLLSGRTCKINPRDAQFIKLESLRDTGAVTLINATRRFFGGEGDAGRPWQSLFYISVLLFFIFFCQFLGLFLHLRNLWGRWGDIRANRKDIFSSVYDNSLPNCSPKSRQVSWVQ